MLLLQCYDAVHLIAVSAGAQTYPWNPDSDSNGFVNFTDLLELLAIYGNEFVLDELPCEIDGDTLYAAAYNAGEKSYLECVRTCRLNNAAIPDLDLFALFADSIIHSYDQTLDFVHGLCAICLFETSQNVPDYVPTDGLVTWYPFFPSWRNGLSCSERTCLRLF
ncbi:hypothetical protein N8134_01540 [Flavobacteriales bacterium]|nr:hypothetical protein [Flavobacteriales bacterium]